MKARLAVMIVGGALAPLVCAADPFPKPALPANESLMTTNASEVVPKPVPKPSDVICDMQTGRVAYGVVTAAAGSVINEPAGAEVPPSRTQSGNQFVRLSDLIGGAVKDKDGEPVGDIKDVAVDWATKQMAFVILDPKETTGLANQYRYIAISPKALKPTPNDGGFVVNASKHELANAPSFDRALAPLPSDTLFIQHVNLYYQGLH